MTTSPASSGQLGNWPTRPWLAHGVVRHARTAPRRHAFTYPAFHLMLPLRHLCAHPQEWADCGLARGMVRFAPQDHGDGTATDFHGLLDWLQRTLAQHGITHATGECWLQCLPATGGYSFKPVSFWYCLDAQGELAAVLAEVNNTFGQRHCYLLQQPRWGQTRRAVKAFHVSPFCQVMGGYDFRFLTTTRDGQPRITVRVDHWMPGGEQVKTSLSGTLVPATSASVRQAFWHYPLQSWAITARIHWHALRLWLKGVPVHALPEKRPPDVTFVSASPVTL